MNTFQKKQRIIEATVALLLREGIKKTGMQDIAAFAGVSKVTVYKYFGDKDGLLCSVCGWLTARGIAQLQEQIELYTSPAARMMGFVCVLSEFIASGKQELCRSLGLSGGRAAADFAAYEATVREMILTLIRDAKQAHMIDSALEDELIYHYIAMGFCYFQNNTAYRERMRTDANFNNTFLQLIWRNIFIGDALVDIKRNQDYREWKSISER